MFLFPRLDLKSNPCHAPRVTAGLLALVALCPGPCAPMVSSLQSNALGRPGDALRELRELLSRPDKRSRRSALKKLAALGTSEAWVLVASALEDRSGEVADLAQWSLGRLEDPGELGCLLGKLGLRSRDRWVRVRATEALGRVPLQVEARALQRVLKDSDAEVRRTAAWSIERLARRGGLSGAGDESFRKRLLHCANSDRELQVRARAWFALAEVWPARVREELPRLLASKKSELVCVGLALVAELGDAEEALFALEAASTAKVHAVRVQALESLQSLGTRRALAVLIERLETEQEARLLQRIVAYLQRASGKRYSGDARVWKKWQADLEEDWQPLSTGESAALEREREDGDASRSLRDTRLPVLSKRLTFLIDLSGSMWIKTQDGTLPKDVVERRLRETLESLSEDTLFNVIPFTARPHPWEKKLMRASRKNVRDAVKFFERCGSRGTGNVWDALLLALEDEEVDTLVILTDGFPTGGRRHELDLIVPLYFELNAWRKVAIDSVLVDASPFLERHWERLSAGSGGVSISLSLEGAK